MISKAHSGLLCATVYIYARLFPVGLICFLSQFFSCRVHFNFFNYIVWILLGCSSDVHLNSSKSKASLNYIGRSSLAQTTQLVSVSGLMRWLAAKPDNASSVSKTYLGQKEETEVQMISPQHTCVCSEREILYVIKKLGLGEITQWLKLLPYKHKDWGSDSPQPTCQLTILVSEDRVRGPQNKLPRETTRFDYSALPQ